MRLHVQSSVLPEEADQNGDDPPDRLRDKRADQLRDEPPTRLHPRLVEWLLGFVERWDIASLVATLNAVGFVTGIIFWYGDHLFRRAAEQWYFWPFIPDCPLFAGLFVIAFWGIRRGRDWRLFYTITASGLIKYGVWTVVYSLAYWLGGGPVEPMSLAMCLSHLGMILEGIYVSYRILHPVPEWSAGAETTRRVVSTSVSGRKRAGFRLRDVLLSFGWFLLSDVVDYGLGQYPVFDTKTVSLPLMQWHTIFMTMALTVLFLCGVRDRTKRYGGVV